MNFTYALAKATLRAIGFLLALSWISSGSHAADLPSADGYTFVEPMPAVEAGWQFRLTPYAWFVGVSGDVTAHGHTADVNATFLDYFQGGNSGVELDSLAALMGYMEARKGRWGVYGDAVWGRFDFSKGAVRQRNPIANLSLSARSNSGLVYETTMVESGVTYEVAKWGPARSATAMDVLGGARYWNQQADLSLAITGDIDLGTLGLKRSGSRAVARSGTIEWVDPFVGLRVRHELSPGHELQFLGDVGGFGAGSDLTWQLFAGYAFDFTVAHAMLHGVLGYRALAVDYSEGSGLNQNNIDLILHGPVAGLSFRW